MLRCEFLICGLRQWISYASLAADYFGIITPLHEHVSKAWCVECVLLQNKYISFKAIVVSSGVKYKFPLSSEKNKGF